MTVNPFAPGPAKQPPLLAGRDAVFRVFVDQFEDARRGAGHRPVLLYGERGMGKTVVLDRFVKHARQHRWAGVRIELQQGIPLAVVMRSRLPQLYQQLPGRSTHPPRWLRELTLSLGAGPARAELTMARQGTDAVSPTDPLALDNALAELARLIPARSTSGVVVALDEIHQATEADLRAIGRLVQTVNSDGLHVVVTAAGLPRVRELILERLPTYANRFAFFAVGSLDPETTAAALVVPANQAGVLIERDALEALVGLSGGYPYFVQLYGRHAWDVAGGTTIGSGHVAVAHQRVIDDLDRGPYGAGWHRLRPSEQRFLAAMATGPEPATTADLAQQLGLERRGISTIRQRLITGGLIEPAGHGRLRFTLPGYAAYVRHQIQGQSPDRPLPAPSRRRPQPPSLGL